MPRGTAFSVLLTMLKGECGYNMQSGVATAQDTELYQVLQNKQAWLWSQYKWPFLYTHKDVTLAANARYYNFPAGLSFDYPTEVEVKWGTLWFDVSYGIKGEEYEAVDPEVGQTLDPVSRWQNFSLTQFEVWPMPSTVQTLRFWGTATLTTFVDGTTLADLDDLLIVLYAAADKLARAKQKDAPSKLDAANALFAKLKAANKPNAVFPLGGADLPDEYPRPGRQHIVGIASNPNH